jgi:hypothetical protein
MINTRKDKKTLMGLKAKKKKTYLSNHPNREN